MVAVDNVSHDFVVSIPDRDVRMLFHIVLELLNDGLVFLWPPSEFFFHLLLDVLHVDRSYLGAQTLELRDVVFIHSFVPGVYDVEGIFEVDFEPHNLLVPLNHSADEIGVFLIRNYFDQGILPVFDP